MACMPVDEQTRQEKEIEYQFSSGVNSNRKKKIIDSDFSSSLALNV